MKAYNIYTNYKYCSTFVCIPVLRVGQGLYQPSASATVKVWKLTCVRIVFILWIRLLMSFSPPQKGVWSDWR